MYLRCVAVKMILTQTGQIKVKGVIDNLWVRIPDLGSNAGFE